MFLVYKLLQYSSGYNMRYMLLPMTNVLSFHIRNFEGMCPVPSTAIFCSSHYYYFYYCYYYFVSCHGPFLLVLLLNQRWSPLLSLQVLECSTFHTTCDVPSTAVFCSKSSECFPGMVPDFSLNLLLLFRWLRLIPVQPYIPYALYLYTSSCILFTFLFPFACYFYPQVLPYLPACTFLLVYF